MSADISDEQIDALLPPGRASALHENYECYTRVDCRKAVRKALALAAQPEATAAPKYVDSFGYSLAMRMMQSDLYPLLDDRERAECDEVVRRGQATAAREQDEKDTREKCFSSLEIDNYSEPFKDAAWLGWREGREALRESTTPPVGTEAPAVAVYLVATGETHEGEETYTRHEGAPPPLCDFERLYAAPSPPEPAREALTDARREILLEAAAHLSQDPHFADWAAEINRLLGRAALKKETTNNSAR